MKSEKQVEKEIAKRNKLFRSASKAQKRVLVAKDVLEQLARKTFIASPGDWVCGLKQEEGSFQKTMLAGSNSCNCCALGSLMSSLVLFKNKVENSDVANDGLLFFPGILDGKKEDVTGILKLFSPLQLQLIELTFERGLGLFDNCRESDLTYSKVKSGYAFGWKYNTSTGRLRGIMKNIVKNNGTFKP